MENRVSGAKSSYGKCGGGAGSAGAPRWPGIPAAQGPECAGWPEHHETPTSTPAAHTDNSDARRGPGPAGSRSLLESPWAEAPGLRALRITKEFLRITREFLRITKDFFRITRELLRITKDVLRSIKELLRITKEFLRFAKELLRTTKEFLRITKELLRIIKNTI